MTAFRKVNEFWRLLYTSGTHKPSFRFPEEFRLPIGARKSGKTEPASQGLVTMGFSGFGRLVDEREPALTRPGLTSVVR